MGAQYQCFAPDIPQHHVINHKTGDDMDQARNVLVESARIARGDIQPVQSLNVNDFDALILPGGFGAAKNLSDFAFSGAEVRVQVDVLSTAKAFVDGSKPVGLMCIAPALAGRIFGEGVQATIGNDQETITQLEATGIKHINCPVNDIVVDELRKLVTTPAYMLAERISEAAEGIDKLVEKGTGIILRLLHTKPMHRKAHWFQE